VANHNFEEKLEEKIKEIASDAISYKQKQDQNE
jgi:hypothetical protein